ncbi:hypothetical protein NMG60_11003793 [Bertholletia excelsa]
MRIRKRFLSSSISSIALSDPQLNRPAMVRHHPRNLHVEEDNTYSQLSDLPIQPSSPTSDHQPAIRSGGPRWVCSNKLKVLEDEKLKEEKWEEEERNNDTGKRSILLSAVRSGLVPPTSSSHQEDMAVPPKKRKASRGEAEPRPMEKNKKVIMRNYINSKVSKTNKKSMPKSDEDEDKKVRNGHGARKPRRGGAIVEGSRCSRVNGRGWRCSQSTLVGYSLCEHHLGKSRLRSVASVREPIKLCEASLLGEREPLTIRRALEEGGGEETDERKKRTKIGVVKARSMSSLLGQTKRVDGQK